jgi:hypothetical protein
LARKTFIAALLTLVAALFISGCVDKPPKTDDNAQFSATLLSQSGKDTQEYTVYYSHGNVRLDMISPGKGEAVLRKDRGTLMTLMPGKKLFIELPIRPANKMPLLYTPDKIIKYKKLGEDTIEGRPVTKEKITIQNEGDNPKEFYRWFDPAIGRPVMAEDINGGWKLELKDIKMGPQDPTLFDPPAGFRSIVPNRHS